MADDLNDFIKKLEKAAKDLDNKELYAEIAKTTRDSIYKRTKIGRGVSENGGRTEKLKPLSEGYVKTRKKLRKDGKLAPSATPTKSNLTKTGEMLDSLKDSASDSGARIYIEGEENQKKVLDQENAGRTFLRVSKAELDDITQIVEKHIKRQIG